MVKRIAAWIGLGIIAVMYLLTIVAAVLARPETMGLFMASIVLTIMIPIIIWSFLRMYEMSHPEGSMSASEMRKINKRIKSGEKPEDIAKEIMEIHDAIVNGIATYILKYSVRTEKRLLGIKIKSE